jgi:ABC-type sugar transport system substrate-binding protein
LTLESGAVMTWVLLTASVTGLACAQTQRARRRRTLTRVFLLAVMALAPWTFILTLEVLSVSYSDAFNVLGLAVTLVLAIVGTRLEASWRRVTVAVVIPSRVAFFTEIRRGLTDALDGLPVNLVDDYASAARALEDLTDFMPTLRRAMKRRPDFLLLACPTATAASSDETINILTQLARRGGAAFFIENGPPRDRLPPWVAKRVMTIVSDSQHGAVVMADYLSGAYPQHSAVILAGPAGSAPATSRATIFGQRFPEGAVRVADVAGWSRAGAHTAAIEHLEGSPSPTLLICGNDSMALGAAAAVQELGRTDSVVSGYDGVRQVLAAIAEPSNPIVATLRTPASAFGSEAGARMRDQLSFRPIHDASDDSIIVLSVDESHLVTRNSVELLLAELWS